MWKNKINKGQRKVKLRFYNDNRRTITPNWKNRQNNNWPTGNELKSKSNGITPERFETMGLRRWTKSRPGLSSTTQPTAGTLDVWKNDNPKACPVVSVQWFQRRQQNASRKTQMEGRILFY